MRNASGEEFNRLQLCFLQKKLTLPVMFKEVVKIAYGMPEAVKALKVVIV